MNFGIKSQSEPSNYQPEYHGFDQQVERQVKELARSLSRASIDKQRYPAAFNSHISTNDESEHDDNKSITSIFSGVHEGVNPVYLDPSAPGYDARLDPNSEHFSSAAWIKNMVAFSMQDPEYYKHYTIGCCWKDLRAFGDSNDVS